MYNAKGNALFLILIAVALFAALSYAVTNSGRGGGGIDREEADIMAANILNYFAIIQAEAIKLKSVYGVAEYNINFGNDNSHHTSGGAIGPVVSNNPNCTPVLSECSIFSERGGNVPSRAFYDAAVIPIPTANGHNVPGEFRIRNNFVEDVGTATEPELILMISGID